VAPLADAEGAPVYRNGLVTSVDPAKRSLVLKGDDGREETLSFAPSLTNVGEVKAADRVIVTLRGNPAQIWAIAKSEPVPGAVPSPPPSPSLAASPRPRALGPARTAFADRVATLARQAGDVDRVWSDFRRACAVTASRRYDGGREWFGLWDNQVRADISTTPCIDLFNRVVSLGQPVLTGMAMAEEEARMSDVLPGDVRKMRRRQSMDWDGWDKPAPKHVER
jgi:hypothetical protein